MTIAVDLGCKATKQTNINTLKPVLSSHLIRRPKNGFQDQLSLNAGQKYCRMLLESILQYFRPSLSYDLSLRALSSIFEWSLKTGFTVQGTTSFSVFYKLL